MPLSIQELLNLKELPSEEELSLQILAEFYEQLLCNRIFHYKVRHKVGEIKLHFKTSDLPHLLGIHKIKTGSTHRGKRGFPALKSGNLTLLDLKRANEGNYVRIIYRILHFPFINQLMYDPEAIIFRPDLAQSTIDAEFMFYNTYSGRVLHLGIKRETSTDLYIPVTFLERKNPYSNMTKVLIDKIQVYTEGQNLELINSPTLADNIQIKRGL
ncbi:PBECR4 domain-containing protein [Paenibacillus sp. SI8]|uniref:PBECR4 domain-containing protein n=1 Tax=unclassified Paenibacillus TaxID=185978 RepID=UPI003466EF6A